MIIMFIKNSLAIQKVQCNLYMFYILFIYV